MTIQSIQAMPFWSKNSPTRRKNDDSSSIAEDERQSGGIDDDDMSVSNSHPLGIFALSSSLLHLSMKDDGCYLEDDRDVIHLLDDSHTSMKSVSDGSAYMENHQYDSERDESMSIFSQAASEQNSSNSLHSSLGEDQNGIHLSDDSSSRVSFLDVYPFNRRKRFDHECRVDDEDSCATINLLSSPDPSSISPIRDLSMLDPYSAHTLDINDSFGVIDLCSP
jgi:hypothetical protein